jgi:hypothetical protein
MNDSAVIDVLEDFVRKCKIRKPFQGICALTIGEDRGAICGTFLIDYPKRTLLRHYPAFIPKTPPVYTKVDGTCWTVNFATGLKPVSSNGKASEEPEDASSSPFCCGGCSALYKKSLTLDGVFTGFKQSDGSAPFTFRVTKKIQHGDLCWIKYFRLQSGTVVEVGHPETEYKVNSFKVYTCGKHNTYYSVNLYTDKAVKNVHHAKGQNETEYGPALLTLLGNTPKDEEEGGGVSPDWRRHLG